MRTQVIYVTLLLWLALACGALAQESAAPVATGNAAADSDTPAVETLPPYTLEMAWVESGGIWSLRLAMPEAAPGRYDVEVRAESHAPGNAADSGPQETESAWGGTTVLSKGVEILFDVSSEGNFVSEGWLQMPVLVTITPRSGGPGFQHVLAPLDPAAITAPPCELERSWVEQAQGWSIRLKLDGALPGDYLVRGEALLPNPEVSQAPDGSQTTKTQKWSGTVRLRDGIEVFITFPAADAATLEVLRRTPVTFTVTPLAGGRMRSFILEPQGQ